MAERYVRMARRPAWSKSSMTACSKFLDGCRWSTTMPTGPAGAASRCSRRGHFAEVAVEPPTGRPADRRACDRRRRRRAGARRLRGGARQNGRRDSRHRIEHIEVHRPGGHAALCGARRHRLDAAAASAGLDGPAARADGFAHRPARWPLQLCLADAEERRRPHRSSPPTGRSRRSTRSPACRRRCRNLGSGHARPVLHAAEALAGYTVEGAYAEFMEDRKGRCAPARSPM